MRHIVRITQISLVVLGIARCAFAGGTELPDSYVQRLANAIYKAEGGAATKHPYGILQKYKTTTPRQACINTIRNKHKAWVALGSRGDFLAFLASKYCPIGATNDPTGLNKNWLPNVRRFLNG